MYLKKVLSVALLFFGLAATASASSIRVFSYNIMSSSDAQTFAEDKVSSNQNARIQLRSAPPAN